MYAILKTGGKQYRVQEGDIINVERLNPLAEDNEEVTFNEVLFVADGEHTEIGCPYVEGAKVQARVVENGKGEKIIVFKYKAKKDYRRKKGHRQPYTKLEITSIGFPGFSGEQEDTND
ncbi:MAG: 50S ribosomal protein L21 [Eubacteriaceae bacterium]|nr:50S ribosomal protein L21 [Eubacteriaceae bacterium]